MDNIIPFRCVGVRLNIAALSIVIGDFLTHHTYHKLVKFIGITRGREENLNIIGTPGIKVILIGQNHVHLLRLHTLKTNIDAILAGQNLKIGGLFLQSAAVGFKETETAERLCKWMASEEGQVEES